MPDPGNDSPSNWQNFGIPDCTGNAQTVAIIETKGEKTSTWKEHRWYFNDGYTTSYIVNSTDSAYLEFISMIEKQCRTSSIVNFHWMPDAGNSQNLHEFGIPDCSSNSTTAPTPPEVIPVEIDHGAGDGKVWRGDYNYPVYDISRVTYPYTFPSTGHLATNYDNVIQLCSSFGPGSVTDMSRECINTFGFYYQARYLPPAVLLAQPV